MMKIIDNFLKKLDTDRNTFLTYILTLITIYLTVDRVVEFLLMLFTGVSYSYWGPIQYTFALACPLFAFAFSFASKFVPTKKHRVVLFYFYMINFAVIVISMFTQWLNMGAWLLLVSNPGYVDIVTNFSELVRPALTSLTILLPMLIIPKVFKFFYFGVNDSLDMTRSIWDYGGIDLSDKSKGHGPYTCEVFLCQNSETAQMVTIPESSRYQSMFVCGGSGSGKTSLVYEPLIARDLERKYFFREVSKEMGFTALKTGIATLNGPYDNDYLNTNFNLNMLIPTSGNEDVYKAYMKKMILDSSSEITYRNCGVTVLSPDKEILSDMIGVCKNFGLSYNIIDPADKNSIGLNPFVYDDANKIAITISSVLKSMFNISKTESDEIYRDDIITQAIENLSLLLKEMYPRMNDGVLPNLSDMLKMLTNFDLVEKMAEILSHDEELKEKYSVQLAYFRTHFYKNGSNRAVTEKYIYTAVSQLDNLLRLPGVKTILCNRYNNLDFDKMLANGDVTFVCTRRGDLGATSNKAFGLFFLISMQNAVLRRPGTEKSRVPNFLYIDEFPGNATIEELQWWSEEFGKKREWTMGNTIDFNKMEYEAKHGNVKWEFVYWFKPGKLQTFGTKDCAYKIRGENGKPDIGQGKLNYLESKYKEPKKIKTFDFGKYSDGVTTDTEDNTDSNAKKKFDIKNLDFIDDRNEYNPVQTDTTDSNYLFDNEDAIVVDFKKRKK